MRSPEFTNTLYPIVQYVVHQYRPTDCETAADSLRNTEKRLSLVRAAVVGVGSPVIPSRFAIFPLAPHLEAFRF